MTVNKTIQMVLHWLLVMLAIIALTAWMVWVEGDGISPEGPSITPASRQSNISTI